MQTIFDTSDRDRLPPTGRSLLLDMQPPDMAVRQGTVQQTNMLPVLR
jgi:hypothetical protein